MLIRRLTERKSQAADGGQKRWLFESLSPPSLTLFYTEKNRNMVIDRDAIPKQEATTTTTHHHQTIRDVGQTAATHNST